MFGGTVSKFEPGVRQSRARHHRPPELGADLLRAAPRLLSWLQPFWGCLRTLAALLKENEPMAHQVEETGELTRSATITVEAEEYNRQVNKALRQLSNRVKVAGFRKGKIPLSVMKQRYGQAVMRDVIEDLVSDNVNKMLKETENVLHVGVPQVTDVPMEDDGELTFTVDFELRPVIDPIGYMGVKVEKPKAEIANEAVDAELESLRQNNSKLEPVVTREVIETGDIVTVDFEAVGDHLELKDMRSSGVQVEIG